MLDALSDILRDAVAVPAVSAGPTAGSDAGDRAADETALPLTDSRRTIGAWRNMSTTSAAQRMVVAFAVLASPPLAPTPPLAPPPAPPLLAHAPFAPPPTPALAPPLTPARPPALQCNDSSTDSI